MGTPKPREVSWGVEAFSSPPHPPDHTTCPPAPRPAWTLEGQQRPSGKSHSTSQLPPHSWDVFPGRAQPSAWCALRPRVWELVALRRPGRRAEPSRPGTSGGAVSEPSPPPVSGSRCPRSPGHVWPPRHLPIAQTGAPARPWTWREEAGSAVGGAGEQAKERRVEHVTGSGRLGPQPGRGLCRGETPAGSPGPGDLGTWDLGTGHVRHVRPRPIQRPWPPQGQRDVWAVTAWAGVGMCPGRACRRSVAMRSPGSPRLPQTSVLAVACGALAGTSLFVGRFFFELDFSGDIG